MLESYFNMRYCFDKLKVVERIDRQLSTDGSGYICVADGVVLNNANRDKDFRRVTDEAMFSICDSSFVPLYIKWIYGRKREQYCGSMIFNDLVSSQKIDAEGNTTSKYRMAFIGTNQKTLDALRHNLVEQYNPECADMLFYELPFRDVENFDYPGIAKMIEEDGADIIWVALGAPKQCKFMNRLKPHLSHGVMIGVGAAFKFFSGVDEKRAPQWMLDHHLEFVYRIYQEPKKQLSRCGWIIAMLPVMFAQELKKKWFGQSKSYVNK